jgi:hypothetical protein
MSQMMLFELKQNPLTFKAVLVVKPCQTSASSTRFYRLGYYQGNRESQHTALKATREDDALQLEDKATATREAGEAPLHNSTRTSSIAQQAVEIQCCEFAILHCSGNSSSQFRSNRELRRLEA